MRAALILACALLASCGDAETKDAPAGCEMRQVTAVYADNFPNGTPGWTGASVKTACILNEECLTEQCSVMP